MHHERRYLLRPLLHYYGRQVHRWSIIFIIRTISLVLMCLFIDFSGFISYFTIDAHDTHYTLHINCINCISCTYFNYDMNSRCLRSLLATHQRRIVICIYIILSICERVFSITNVLATQSKCIHQEKNIVQSDAPVWVMPLCALGLLALVSHVQYPIQVLRYRVGSTTTL